MAMVIIIDIKSVVKRESSIFSKGPVHPTWVDMRWQESLGEQIKLAREKAGLTQESLASAVGRCRQMIRQYEEGSAALPADVLAKIAVEVRMSEFNLNGYRFVISETREQLSKPSADQLRLDFDREIVFPHATIKITPTRASITITATAPLSRQTAA